MGGDEAQNEGQNEPQESAALVALTALGREAPRPPSPAELDTGLGILRARVAAGRARRTRWRRWTLAGVAVTACAMAVVQIVAVSRHRGSRREPLAVSRVEGGDILEGGYLSQSGKDGVRVIFGEGSTFELAPGTRGRLRAVANGGAHLAVERGTASLRITPNQGRRWLIEAGPFTVTVKGTTFAVSWDPSSERFEVRLQEGRVLVSGPTVGDALALRGGQRLVVSLPQAESIITNEPPSPTGAPASEPPSEGPPARTAPPLASLPSPRSATTASAGVTAGTKPAPRRWAEALAKGRWDDILADVDRSGVTSTLETVGSEELFVLADAARYRRRPDLAHEALTAQRRRFPRSPRSLDAIFLLGRVEELRASGTASAIRWYEEYLARAPRGAYAAEALGRKMILTNEMEGPAAARSIADTYLLRFPNGSYAGSARALQRVP